MTTRREKGGRLLRLITGLLIGLMAIAAGVDTSAAIAQVQNRAAPAEESPLTAPGGPAGSLAIRTIGLPQALIVTGQAYIVYEIALTNFQTRPILLTSLAAQAGKRASQEWNGKALAEMVDLPPRYKAGNNHLLLEPLTTRILLIWLPIGAAKNLPDKVYETIDYRLTRGNGSDSPGPSDMSVTTAPHPIDLSPQLSLAPPLRGNLWLAANGPSNTSGHARAFFFADGHIYFPERFAIDFVQLGKDGMTYSGDPKKNSSYHCYSAHVLAVADGVVTAVKDGILDNTPGSLPEAITLSNIAGNYVVLDLGHGRYAFYAHLIPGSIRVHVGEEVRRGALLGQVGNSGNSSEPHLHFQIVNGSSPLAAQGLAYTFSGFTLVPGQVEEQGEHFKFIKEQRPAEKVRDSLMLENEVVNFPSN